MSVVDTRESWDPVPHDRPLRLRVPAPRPARPERARRPRLSVLALPAPHLRCLGPAVPRLLEGAEVVPGSRVVVDLGRAATVDLAGLALLLSVLWRRVGPEGQVVLAGGTPALRGRLGALGCTPQDCRASVLGTARGDVAPAADQPVRVPAPRQSEDVPWSRVPALLGTG